MSTCIIYGTVLDPSSVPVQGIPVTFNTQTQLLSTEPFQGSTVTAVDGTWSLTLQQGLSGVFTMLIPPSGIGRSTYYRFNSNIPATASASFSSTVVDS